MPRIETLIDAYVDANIILIIGFLVWSLGRATLNRTRFGQDHLLHLRLTEGMILAAIISPILAALLARAGAVFFPGISLSAADIALAQFLNGHVAMKAQDFEAVLTARQAFIADLVRLDTWQMQGLAAVLGAGFLWRCAHTLRDMARLRRLISSSYLWRRFGRLDLRLSDATDVPFSTRGLTRRHIVIPSGMLAMPDELRIALAHEIQHMRRKDTEWEVALVVLAPVFFLNPVYHWWKRGLEQLRELACDQVLLNRARVTPRAYAECLLTVSGLRASRAMAGQYNLITPRVPFLNFGGPARRNRQALVQRITAMTDHRAAPALRPALIWPMLVAGGFVLALGTAALQRPGDWSQDRLMLSTIVNLERLETRNAGLGQR